MNLAAENDGTGADRRLLVFPFALGAALLITNHWFTEVDDECAIIDQAAQPLSHTFRAFLSGVGQHEHPPLYDILLHVWLMLTGGSIYLLRLPSIVFYVLGAWIIAKVAERLGGKRSQFWALVIVTLWPFGFHFGRVTTWYSFCFLLVSLLTYAYFKFADQPSASNGFWVVFVSLALVYSNYFGWAFLGCLAFDYLVRNRREGARASLRLVAAAAILLLAYLPMFRAFHRETSVGIRATSLTSATAANFVYNVYCVFVSESVAPWFWFLGIPACVAIGVCLLVTFWRTTPAGKALLVYFLVLLGVLAGLGIVVPKRVLLMSPWLILPIALALGIHSNQVGRRVLASALVLIAAIGWCGIFSRRLYAAPHWVEPWKSIAQQAAAVAHEQGVVVGNNPSFFFYLTYLLPTKAVDSNATGFAGLLPDSVRASGAYDPKQWADAGHPVARATLLVKGLHYGSSADLTEETQLWLDAHCSLDKIQRLVHDRGAQLKQHYSRIAQPEWRIEIREYACREARR